MIKFILISIIYLLASPFILAGILWSIISDAFNAGIEIWYAFEQMIDRLK